MNENQNSTTNLELQLVIIGILLPIFWETLPALLQPISLFSFKMDVARYFSYALGASWFLNLLVGAYCVVEKGSFVNWCREKYGLFFKINIITTGAILILATVAYGSGIVAWFMTKYIPGHMEQISWGLVVLSIIVNSIFLLVTIWRNKNA